jgi:nitronate monooxygenase
VLVLGAVGGWLGTRFVASHEWGGRAWEQRAVVAASADDTVRTTAFDRVRRAPFPDGIADRVLRNAFTDAWHGRETEIDARREELARAVATAARDGDASMVDVSAGVAVGLIGSLEPAAAIVQGLVGEAEQVLRARAGSLLR